MHRFTKALTLQADDPLGYGGRLPFTSAEVDGLPIRDDGARRYICQVGNTEAWHCAFLHDGTGDFFIIVNKERVRSFERAGLDAERLPVAITLDTSPYGMAMPEELGEYLAQDEELNTYFHALTPGKQRALIHLVAKPKTSPTRLRKATHIAEYLVAVRGKLDFKELNAWGKRES